ncbi:endo-polygalacturonase-like [Bacillus rossius redtenbacheri]|uniref:endo-polygalacturonase-like n=1 Tax=Bacillus rossius redtenbacheri TaxID=93214 RepID=UPI002FDD9C65
MHYTSVIALALAILHIAVAKDLRSVSEPKIPSACTSLKGTGKEETSVIQKALSSCGSGKAVHLASGTFISGPLTIPSGVGLWVDSGAVLKASTNPKDFDEGKNTCGTLDNNGKGCKPLITIKSAKGSGIYGKGTIDGQGGQTMTGKGETWWKLAADAKTKNKKQNAPRLIQIENSNDITLYLITLKNSPNFHVASKSTNGFTAWGVTINTPGTARNTDGIDPMGSQNVTITHCNIATGDDNVAIKAGNAPTKYVSITNNKFGVGHGMSIGSEVNDGVSSVTVSTLTLDGTTNGLRIKSDKSRGGLVTGVAYTNVCMHNVKNPIVLDTQYSSSSGSHIPTFKGITFNNIKVLTAGTFTFDGISDSNPVEATLNDVHIKSGSKWVTKYAKISGKYSEDASGSSC